MKHLKLFEELTNISKVRKWPTRESENGPYSDYYSVYSLKKDELGKYLNTWFEGVHFEHTTSRKGKGQYPDQFVTRDEMITLKKVDTETKRHLYNREYNPISLTILCPTGAKFRYDENKMPYYTMKADIHSIDDSSYGIWWPEVGFTYDRLVSVRKEIMDWVSKKDIINGEEFLDFCEELGAAPDQRDYN